MTDWRAVAVGLIGFLVATVAALLTTPPYLFVVGGVGGIVAAYVAPGGLRSGLWHGLLVGVGEFLVVNAVIVAIVAAYRTEYTYPGYGFGLAFLFVLGLVYVLEATTCGLLVGTLRR